MRIASHELEPFFVESARPRQGIIVRLVDDSGLVGRGEASPLIGFSRDDLGTSLRVLRSAAGAIGRLREEAPPREAIARALAEQLVTLEASASARFALETALFDLVAQRRRSSIAACLRGARPHERVDTNGLVDGFASPEDLVARALSLVQAGFRTVKIKLRARTERAFAAELDAIRALVSALPSGIELRFDANAAWTCAEARTRLTALAAFQPAFVEQPVAPEALADLGNTAVKWAADESLSVPGMPERLLALDACAAFVIKPAVHGLLRAFDLASMAQRRGVGVVITHLFDGPIATAAAAELALATPEPPLACGLDVAWPIPTLAHRGWIVAAAPMAAGEGTLPSCTT